MGPTRSDVSLLETAAAFLYLLALSFGVAALFVGGAP